LQHFPASNVREPPVQHYRLYPNRAIPHLKASALPLYITRLTAGQYGSVSFVIELTAQTNGSQISHSGRRTCGRNGNLTTGPNGGHIFALCLADSYRLLTQKLLVIWSSNLIEINPVTPGK